jgi:hypothetical protein
MAETEEPAGGTHWQRATTSPADTVPAKPTRLEPQATEAQPSQIHLYFDRAIKEYVLPDIDRLKNEIPPAPGGCSVPLAMLLFAVVDLFGALMRPERSGNTEQNLKHFLTETEYLPQPYADNHQALYRVFRNGIAHQIFPKDCGIGKAPDEEQLIYRRAGTPFLNVRVFAGDILAALDAIEAEIVQNPHSQLVRQMNDRMETILKNDRLQCKHLRESREPR